MSLTTVNREWGSSNDEGHELKETVTAPHPSGKTPLREEDCYEKLGFSYPTKRKWLILTCVFMVQTSMNFNASVYGNAVKPLSEHFNISDAKVRRGQMVFLLAYAFGCELWAPWSEELGRWGVLQWSLGLVNLWQIPCALAKNFDTILAGRFLGGLSSAGGSVTLGMVADMWDLDEQQYAVAFVVLSSVGGSVVGPVVGGFIEQYFDWRWNFWIQLIFGLAVQGLHAFVVPETRSTVLTDREAKRRREDGEGDVYGPNELRTFRERFKMKEIVKIWVRPFVMFVREPIVLWLSLLSGFSDALIFTFLESYGYVFEQWNFSTVQLGLAFLPLLVGYFIAYFSFMPVFHKHRSIMRNRGTNALAPEARLWWLLFTAPLLSIGLFGFAWSSLGPPTPWIVPLVFSGLVGIANYAIYMATIDYMVASYGPYAASATGGNGFARDFLAGISSLYAGPLYKSLGIKNQLAHGSTLLACLAVVATVPIYIFYYYGPKIRARSKFALSLEKEREVKANGMGDRVEENASWAGITCSGAH
ncbi:MFS general substrate transporter [Lepidopterella palustris CBS 459.81]|uniref:MFS general substrate transporter n=1 Tax=Lepidopterella palustris CBS 459.81 TaxID=1314670 RepID=A0A8E2E2J4_9PEZI|nr:MFS general substrate transporter [Lepidopterella palustris CBS 459.81]